MNTDIDLYSDREQKRPRCTAFPVESDESEENRPTIQRPKKKPSVSSQPPHPPPPPPMIHMLSPLELRQSSTQRELPSNSSKDFCNCSKNEGLLKKIWTVVEELRQEVRSLWQVVCQKVDEAEQMMHHPAVVLASSLSELEANNSAANEGEFRKIVMQLGKLGGRDINEATRRVLASVMTNDVALQLNWVGSKNEKRN